MVAATSRSTCATSRRGRRARCSTPRLSPCYDAEASRARQRAHRRARIGAKSVAFVPLISRGPRPRRPRDRERRRTPRAFTPSELALAAVARERGRARARAPSLVGRARRGARARAAGRADRREVPHATRSRLGPARRRRGDRSCARASQRCFVRLGERGRDDAGRSRVGRSAGSTRSASARVSCRCRTSRLASGGRSPSTTSRPSRRSTIPTLGSVDVLRPDRVARRARDADRRLRRDDRRVRAARTDGRPTGLPAASRSPRRSRARPASPCAIARLLGENEEQLRQQTSLLRRGAATSPRSSSSRRCCERLVDELAALLGARGRGPLPLRPAPEDPALRRGARPAGGARRLRVPGRSRALPPRRCARGEPVISGDYSAVADRVPHDAYDGLRGRDRRADRLGRRDARRARRRRARAGAHASTIATRT